MKNGIVIWDGKVCFNCVFNFLFIFLGVGVLFLFCMREDYKLMLEISKRNYSFFVVLGCCEVVIRNIVGTMI